jgi:uncharacterized protein
MPARVRRIVAVIAVVMAVPALAIAALAIPPKPAHYFNDGAGLVSADVAQRLDDRLRGFDQSTSNQILVAIFPELPSPSMEDFTIRAAEAWGAGKKKVDNGAVLFVFVKDHKSRLEVGYGLEEKIPDVVAKRIVQDVLSPAFKQQRYADGLNAAITAIIAAIGAPAGVQPTPARPRPQSGDGLFPFPGIPIIIVVLLLVFARRNRGGWGGGGWGGGWSSGGWSSGGSDWSSGSGGGGGFSGGGGSFGGGGASGDW